MRNCFVPKCDNKCKNHPRRMMFLPPKDPQMFEMWKEVLPKKREFKMIDKVCERHFTKDDIITTFDHVINGQLLQMERGRPRIKRTAIPSLNLEPDIPAASKTVWTTKRSNYSKGTRLKRSPKKTQDKDESDGEKSGEKEFLSIEEVVKVDNTKEIEVSTTVETPLTISKDEHYHHVDELDKPDGVYEQFETLYDDIFEVTLPSTLWGIHREPERRFVAFSCFDAALMRNTKCILLNNVGCLRVSINGKLISEQNFGEEITPEFISNILNEIEDTAFCLRTAEGNDENCELIAQAGSELCGNCS